MKSRVRYACSLLLAALGLTTQVARLPGQDSVIVSVGGELSSVRGDSFRIAIVADMRKAGTHKLGSYTIRMSWNPKILYYNYAYAPGTFAEPVMRTDSAFYGVLWITGISAAGRDGLFDLVNLRFRADSADVDTVRLQVTEASAAGSLVNLLTATTVAARPGAYCPAIGRWGDLDKDRQANSRDALAILSNLVGLPTTGFNLALGDVDGDGKVNSRDALIVLSYGVGIDISGQRVLLVAGGVCTSGQVSAVVVVPDTADLVVGQSVRLLAFTRDATGSLTTINDLHWTVTDPRIAAIDQQGYVVAREPGTTTVTAATGPGTRVQAVLVSRARRVHWYANAQAAARNPVQLGTQKWPFASPGLAFSVVSEGDTLHVAPGTYDYTADYGDLDVGIVVVGDTLPGNVRPVLRWTPDYFYNTAFEWTGGVRGELHHLVLRGFYYGVYNNGLRNLLLRNVKIEEPELRYAWGVYVNQFVDTLRVLNSQLLGDPALGSDDGIYVGNGAGLVEIHDTEISYWGDAGFTGFWVNLLDVQRSQFNYNDFAGIYIDGDADRPVNARISRSRFLDNYYEALRAVDARSLVLDHNYIYQVRDDAIEVDGATALGQAIPGSKLTMLGDSIKFRASAWDWIYAADFDSVLIDSLWVENPADTAMSQYGYIYANYARLRDSKLLNLYTRGFYFYGRELVVHNSDLRGCAVCTWNNAYAITAYADNDSGPRVTLTNSRLFNLYEGLGIPGTNTKAGPLLVTGNTIDSVSYGVDVNADSVIVADNVLTRIQTRGIWVWPSLTAGRPFVTARVLRNQVTCKGTGSRYGLEVDHGPALFEDNTVNACVYGIYGSNTSYPLASFTAVRNTVQPAGTAFYHVGIRPDGKWRPTLRGNKVAGGYYGIDVTVTDTATVVVDSNVVSGAGQAGMQLYFISGSVTGRKNNVTNNLVYGIYNTGAGTRNFTLGRFVGNQTRAIYNAATGTFGAQQNWWGNAAGPGGGVADSVFGAVDVSNHLAADPADVPAPAPSLVSLLLGADATAVSTPTIPATRSPRSADKPSSARDDGREQRAARQAAKDAEREARRPREPSPPEHRPR